MIRNTNQEELENMKATGIVRRVNELGRLVIPKEIRRTIHRSSAVRYASLTAIRSLRWQAEEKENSLEKQ